MESYPTTSRPNTTTSPIIPVTMETRCFHKKLEFQRSPPKDFCTARYEHKSWKKQFQIFQKPGKKKWKRDVPNINYPKKKPAEDTLVPSLWGTREKNVRFARIICSRCCTRRSLRFHVENRQHADLKQLMRR